MAVNHLIGGQIYDFGTEEVEEKMRRQEPAPITKTTYTAHIEGKDFPVKQIISAVTGLQSAEFYTLEACLALRKLGYDLSRQRHIPDKSI